MNLSAGTTSDDVMMTVLADDVTFWQSDLLKTNLGTGRMTDDVTMTICLDDVRKSVG